MTIQISVETHGEACLVTISENGGAESKDGNRRQNSWHNRESQEIVPPGNTASFALTGGQTRFSLTPLADGITSWDELEAARGECLGGQASSARSYGEGIAAEDVKIGEESAVDAEFEKEPGFAEVFDRQATGSGVAEAPDGDYDR